MGKDFTSLAHGFVINSVELATLAMTPANDIVGGGLCGVPIHKRGDLLSPHEVEVLNAWACTNMRFGWLDLSSDEVVRTILQLEEVDPTQSPSLIKLGDKHYRSRSNATNRMLVKSRLGSETSPGYVYDMLQCRWVVADALIVDALAMLASAQHRLTAVVIARVINPMLRLTPVPIVLGLPPQFVDFIDRGKSRTPKDREYRADNFSPELVSEWYAEPPQGDAFAKLRNAMSGVLVAVSNNVFSRLSGNNVHPSKAQSPEEGVRIRLQTLFGDGLDVQRVITAVHAYTVGVDGKKLPWTKVFSPTMVATALLLQATESSDPIESVVHTIDKQEPLFAVDFDRVREFLDALKASSGEPSVGPFGPALADITKVKATLASKGGGKPSEQELFQCLVKAMGQFSKDGTTGAVWLTSRERKKAEKLNTWLTFGGADKGPDSEE